VARGQAPARTGSLRRTMDDIDASRIMRDFFVQHPHERRGLKSQLPCTQIDEEPNDSATAYQASTGRRSMQPEERHPPEVRRGARREEEGFIPSRPSHEDLNRTGNLGERVM
jgi:hypothetical protein